MPGTQRHAESGNVLFLILIAVVLFAALSYAVAGSIRTPENRSDTQTNSILASEISQYPTGLRVAIIQMLIGGSAVDTLEFNSPSAFDDIGSLRDAVFHPEGGGAIFQQSPPGAMAANAQGTWYFNAHFEIDNIGMESAGTFAGNDIVAFLPGIHEGVCRHINRQMGLDAIPVATADLSPEYTQNMDSAYVPPAGETVIGDLGANGTDALTGQPNGCFRNTDGTHVYYHVLTER